MSDVPAGVLLPYQARWCADTTPVRVIEKSRRIGITWAEAGDAVLRASKTSGEDVFYIGYNRDMTLEFIEATAEWARDLNAAAEAMEEFLYEDEDQDIQAFRIRFASGFKIVALSSRPANLRGKQGHVIIDEAAFHDQIGELLKAALALIMWGGSVSVISTHDGDENPFNELIKDIRADRKPFSLHRITIDDALAEGLYKRICLRKGDAWSPEAEAVWRKELIEFYGQDADEELFCIPRRGAGAYLPGTLVEHCMNPELPVVRWEREAHFAEAAEAIRQSECQAWCEETLLPLLEALPQHLLSYFGEDFGRTGDLTVIMPLQVMPNLVRRAPFVVELRNIPFAQQEQVLFFIADRLPRFMGGALDARGNGQYLAEVAMQRYGSARIAQVMLSTEWYREHMPRYKAAFEDGTIELPRDADLLADHRALRMEKGVARVPESLRGTGSDGKQRHGDAAIAGAMAFFAAQRETVDYEYERARSTRDRMEGGRPFHEERTDFFGNPERDDGGLARGSGAW